MKRQIALATAAIFFVLNFISVNAAFSDGIPPFWKEGYKPIIHKTMPAVVSVLVSKSREHQSQRSPKEKDTPQNPEEKEQPQPEPRGPEQGGGSGVIITSDGYIVTNNHVIEGTKQVTVVLNDSRSFFGKVIGADPKTDIGVVKIEAENLPFMRWGTSEKLEVGDLVLALGSPFTLLQSSASAGIVSALSRAGIGIADYEDFIQTDAAINPGNSGGALVNMNGELVGINTAIFSRSGGNEGVGFAVPQAIAQDIAEQLIKIGRVVRGWLGVAIQEITPALAKSFKVPDGVRGALISDVNEMGPALKAGIMRGDVVIEFNGKAVTSVKDLRNMVARFPVEHDVRMVVLRQGEKMEFTVLIKEKPSDKDLTSSKPASPETAPQSNKFDFNNVLKGIEVQDLAESKLSGVHGVTVVNVESGTVAGDLIAKGDVILEINQIKVIDTAGYTALAGKIGPNDHILLLVQRKMGTVFIMLEPR